ARRASTHDDNVEARRHFLAPFDRLAIGRRPIIIAGRTKPSGEESPMPNALRTAWIAPRVLLPTALIAWSAASPVRAEYPERQIRMTAGFPAGGGTDIAARLINTPLGEALGKPVIVENRGGASGNISIAAAARAAGDGHTLLICSSAYVVNPSLFVQV